MVRMIPPNPNHMVPPSTAGDPPPSSPIFSLIKRPSVRVTSEFDTDSYIFCHKISCKVLDSLTKFKVSFQNNNNGEISEPQVKFVSKHLSIHYDVEEQNTLLKGSFDVRPRLHFRASHDVKAQQGEMAMVANLDPGYSLELSSAVPTIGLWRATFKFPFGKISFEDEEEEEVKKKLSINGILKGQILKGVCTAHFTDEDLRLRYTYKDEKLSFTPSIYFPSSAASFAFKHRFSPSHQLSYWCNFDSNDWTTVYKHKIGKDYKFKAGYVSVAHLGWASVWVGEESGNTKTSPLKITVQVTLLVPKDDIRSSSLMFRVKKRWDI